MCGAMASKGADLTSIRDMAVESVKHMGTLGVCISPCSLPGEISSILPCLLALIVRAVEAELICQKKIRFRLGHLLNPNEKCIGAVY